MTQEDPKTGLVLPAGHHREKATRKCKKGHYYQSVEPFGVEIVIDGKVAAFAGPLCPTCLRNWLERHFGTTDVGEKDEKPKPNRRQRRKGQKDPRHGFPPYAVDQAGPLG